MSYLKFIKHAICLCNVLSLFCFPSDSFSVKSVLILLVLNVLVLCFLGRWVWKRWKKKQFTEDKWVWVVCACGVFVGGGIGMGVCSA